MKFARGFLIIQALVAIIFGIVFLVNPISTAEFLGLQAINQDGKQELITMYVGMNVAVNLFFLYAGVTSRMVFEACFFFSIFFSGLAAGRVYGMIMFDTVSGTMSGFVFDSVSTVIGWFIVYKLNEVKNANNT